MYVGVCMPVCSCVCSRVAYAYVKPNLSVAQLDAPSDWRPGGRGFNPRRGRQHSFVEIDHEIFSTVSLSLPLIQQLAVVSFWRKNVHNTGYPLRGLSLPSKRVVR